MLQGSANGVTGLYNVSNTCYMNSVLQALSHVREFRECMFSDEAATSLNAADLSRGSPAASAPITADEILSFPGFRSRRKRKKTESGEDEPTIVPPSEFLLFGHPPLFPRVSLSKRVTLVPGIVWDHWEFILISMVISRRIDDMQCVHLHWQEIARQVLRLRSTQVLEVCCFPSLEVKKVVHDHLPCVWYLRTFRFNAGELRAVLRALWSGKILTLYRAAFLHIFIALRCFGLQQAQQIWNFN